MHSRPRGPRRAGCGRDATRGFNRSRPGRGYAHTLHALEGTDDAPVVATQSARGRSGWSPVHRRAKLTSRHRV